MKHVFWIAVVVAVALAGWRTVEPEVANVQLQDDLRDSAQQLGWHSGLTGPNSDEDLRNIIIQKAKKHGITIDPRQITIRHGGTEQYPVWFIAADYRVNIDLLVYSFALHFNPDSKGKGEFWGSPEPAGFPGPLPSPAKALPEPSPQRPNPARDTPKQPELKKIPESLKRPQ